MNYFGTTTLDALMGLTMESVTNVADAEILFVTTDGRAFHLYHEQDCCEHVRVDDVVGELDFLVGSPILLAEEVSNEGAPPPEGWTEDYGESYTWTFYRFGTLKGYVDIKWLGSSNGYYSESVSFAEIERNAE